MHNVATTTSSQTRITILIDNQAKAGFAAEHGLSLWIETDNRHILFDTGQSGAFVDNAKALGIDLRQTDCIILSHGHYDHSGGLGKILRRAKRADLYCHPGSVSPRYSIRNSTVQTIRMPSDSMAALDRMPQEHLHWIQRRHALGEHIELSGPIPREVAFEDTGGPFFLDQRGQRPDPIDDDLALWVHTPKGLIVIVGCAHAGLVNTLRQARLCNAMPIRAVIGGFHLHNATPDRLQKTMAALQDFSPDVIIPCHCTGEMAVAALRDIFHDRVVTGATGNTFTF